MLDVERSVPNSAEALQKAVAEFLITDKGRELIEREEGIVSWREAFWNIPAELWAKYGITVLNRQAPERIVYVSQNEKLNN